MDQIQAHWKRKIVLFFISQGITLFGSALVQFAIVWYVTLKTTSGAWVAALTICSRRVVTPRRQTHGPRARQTRCARPGPGDIGALEWLGCLEIRRRTALLADVRQEARTRASSS